MRTCNAVARYTIIYILGCVCGVGLGLLNIRRSCCHHYRELDRAERVTRRRRFGEKILYDTIMMYESFDPYSKEGYVRIDSGVADVEMGAKLTGGSRAKKTNSIFS